MFGFGLESILGAVAAAFALLAALFWGKSEHSKRKQAEQRTNIAEKQVEVAKKAHEKRIEVDTLDDTAARDRLRGHARDK